MKLNAFAVFGFLTCFLVALQPMAFASEDTEVYVIALDSTGESHYMKSSGDGTFTPQESIGYVDNYSYGNGVGDFDNDGDLDYIMGVGYCDGSIHLYEKLGPGNQFASWVDVGAWEDCDYPAGIAVADFNEDGNLDFILTFYVGTNSELYTGDGKLGFTRTMIIESAPEYSLGADAADFNNDGHADFVVAPYGFNAAYQYFTVNIGHGDGTFTTIEFDSRLLDDGVKARYWGVAAGDFDSDGIPDLATTANGLIDIYLGVGDGTFDFGHPIEDPGVFSYAPVDNYDFNNDGIQDIVIGNYGTESPQQNVGVFLGDGEGWFNHSDTYIGTDSFNYYAIAAPPHVIDNKSPVALIDPAYQEITVGQTVLFSGESSYDEDGEIVSYTWSFGDPSISEKQLQDPSLSEEQIQNEGDSGQHVYYQTGLYTITLTVTDDRGATNSVEAQVLVKPMDVRIKFEPRVLNSGSKGKWVQATIKLPRGYRASHVDLNSVRIAENGKPIVYAQLNRKWNKFFKLFKRNPVGHFTVKFDRQELLAHFSGDPCGNKRLQVQGTLSQRDTGSISFEGSDTIRIQPPKKDKTHKNDKKGKEKKPKHK